MSQPVDIGHGVTIRFYESGGVRAGLVEEHDLPGGAGRCAGVVHFRGRPGARDGQHTWVVESEEPLTLPPSVLCRTCGNHGYIRDGKWVPA